jgi:hypothetical protein
LQAVPGIDHPLDVTSEATGCASSARSARARAGSMAWSIGRHSPTRDRRGDRLRAVRAVHGVNVDGTFLGCKYGLALMKRGGDRS